jgi:hypothetical protein
VTPASTRHGKRRLVCTLLVSSEGAHKLVRGEQPLDRRRLPEPLQRQSHNPERLEFLVQLGALAR